jgi:nitroreductase
MANNLFLETLQFRHACKIFDSSKDISKKDFKNIIDMAALSPSSFGLEQWSILSIEDKESRERLKPICWGQEQITTSSKLLIILARKEDMDPNSSYVKNMFKRKKLPKDIYKVYMKKYRDFIGKKSKKERVSWSQKQCYIYATNLVNAAASLKIDSCMIEGFEHKKVTKLLNIDRKKYEIALIVALGYRKSEQPKKFRLDPNQYIKVI